MVIDVLTFLKKTMDMINNDPKESRLICISPIPQSKVKINAYVVLKKNISLTIVGALGENILKVMGYRSQYCVLLQLECNIACTACTLMKW